MAEVDLQFITLNKHQLTIGMGDDDPINWDSEIPMVGAAQVKLILNSDVTSISIMNAVLEDETIQLIAEFARLNGVSRFKMVCTGPPSFAEMRCYSDDTAHALVRMLENPKLKMFHVADNAVVWSAKHASAIGRAVAAHPGLESLTVTHVASDDRGANADLIGGLIRCRTLVRYAIHLDNCNVCLAPASTVFATMEPE